MIESKYSITVDATDEVELLLAEFERVREAGPVDLRDFAPSPDDPAFQAVVTELARIDLERAFDEGVAPDASRYLDQFPDVFRNEGRRSQLAFEEYRLRRRSGEDVAGVEVGHKYDLDGSRWPSFKLGGDAGPTGAVSRRFSKQDLTPPRVHFPNVGEVIAGYRLISRLGEGAYSRVFVARQPDLASRLVVLKVTPLSTDESDRLASLQHSAIIPVYSVHSEGDLTCICMPFLGATTLADLSRSSARWTSRQGPAQELVSTIRDRRQSTIQSVRESSDSARKVVDPSTGEHQESDASVLPESSVLPEASVPSVDAGLSQLSELGYVEALVKIVSGAVAGLAYAHARGVIHRDLKPANVLLADDGSPILLDFNLAVSASEPQANVVGGTLPYMSPQQLEALRTGEAADKRDDVFSVGVILYELLAGRLPFKCPNNGEPFELADVIADRIVSPTSIRRINAGVSRGLEAIIMRCLEPKREDRYADADALLEDLSRHQNHLPLKYANDRSIRERLSKWSARHPRLASATCMGAIAALLLLLMSVVVLRRGDRIATLDARTQYESFSRSFPDAVLTLSTPGYEAEVLVDGVEQSKSLLHQWLSETDPSQADRQLERLGLESQGSLNFKLAKLAYLTANAQFHLARQSESDERQRLLAEASVWNQVASSRDSGLRELAEYQRGLLNGGSPDDFSWGEHPSANATLDVLALRAMESGDPTMWRQLADRQLEAEPTNVSHWASLALANNRLGDLQASANCFDVAIRMLPRSTALHLNRGICRLDLGELDRAIEDFTFCVNAKPDQLVPRYNRALAYHRLGNHDKALEDLNRLIDRGHVRTRIVLLRAQVNDAIGNRSAGDSDRRMAIQVVPRDANDWIARGVLHLQDSAQQALSDFQNALRLDPNHVVAINNLAHVYAERLNDPERGIEMLTRLIRLRPDSASAYASRGILYARRGAFEAALDDARRVGELSPSGLEQLQLAGIFAMASERDEDPGLRAAAMRWLAHALQQEATLASIARVDTDLKRLQGDPEFNRLIASAADLASDR